MALRNSATALCCQADLLSNEISSLHEEFGASSPLLRGPLVLPTVADLPRRQDLRRQVEAADRIGSQEARGSALSTRFAALEHSLGRPAKRSPIWKAPEAASSKPSHGLGVLRLEFNRKLRRAKASKRSSATAGEGP